MLRRVTTDKMDSFYFMIKNGRMPVVNNTFNRYKLFPELDKADYIGFFRNYGSDDIDYKRPTYIVDDDPYGFFENNIKIT